MGKFILFLFMLAFFQGQRAFGVTASRAFDDSLGNIHFFAHEPYSLEKFPNILKKFVEDADGAQISHPSLYAYQEQEKINKKIEDDQALLIRLLTKIHDFYHKAVNNYQLKKDPTFKLNLWCGCGTASGKDRMLLLLKILDDVCSKNYDKFQEIVYTSLGSGGLLFDFFVAISLIELGFKKITLNFIDPMYENNIINEYKDSISIPLDEFIEQKNEIPASSYTINWHTNGYDYIQDVLLNKKKKSHIIIGIDYGDGGGFGGAVKDFPNCSQFLDCYCFFFYSSPPRIFFKGPVNQNSVNFFLNAVAYGSENIDVNLTQEKIITTLKQKFSDESVSFFQIPFKTFDDLKKYTSYQDSITYQLHDGLTSDGDLGNKIKKYFNDHIEYDINLQFKLIQLRYKLENLKSKLTQLKNGLRQLSQKLVVIS